MVRIKDWKIYLITIKRYFQRTTGYVGLINSIMIGLLFLQNRNVNVDLTKYGIFIIGFTVIAFIILGYIEDRIFGFYEIETKFGAVRNPILMEIREDIKEIKKTIKDK